MKNLKLVLLTVLMGLSPQGHTLESIPGMELGVTVLTSKVESTGESKVEGVVFMNYDGYEQSIGEDQSLNLVPTSVEVSVDGKKVKAYTNLATYQTSFRELELSITGLKIEYEKRDDLAIFEQQKVALVDLAATKFFSVGSMEIDVTLAASFGGQLKTKARFMDGSVRDVTDDHNYTVDLGAGAYVGMTDDIDVYFYGGKSITSGEATDTEKVYAGLEVFGGEITKNITYSPFIEYVSQKTEFSNRFDSVEDSAILIGIRITN